MPGQEPTLKDQDRAKLDGIVSKMTANKESDAAIQAVVNDFKSKYAVKSEETATPEPVKKRNFKFGSFSVGFFREYNKDGDTIYTFGIRYTVQRNHF